jgi:hypothetical protein
MNQNASRLGVRRKTSLPFPSHRSPLRLITARTPTGAFGTYTKSYIETLECGHQIIRYSDLGRPRPSTAICAPTPGSAAFSALGTVLIEWPFSSQNHFTLDRGQPSSSFSIGVTIARSSRGLGRLRGIYFFWAILLEQHAKQLISGNRNNQNNAADHANHKHPTQNMGNDFDQGIKRIHAPEDLLGILLELKAAAV